MASKRKPEEAMTPIEIRERVAREVFGLEIWVETRGGNSGCIVHDPKGPVLKPWMHTKKEYQKPERYRLGTLADIEEFGFFGTGLREYETDIAAAWQVEERIMELGLVVDYGRALQGIVRAEQGMVVNSSNIAGPINAFNIAHATPMQRCKAAINAVEAAK